VRGFLSASHKPLLQNNDLGSERRPDFALEEYRSLVRILANTGIREGTEAERILGVSNEQLAHCRSTDVVLGEFREFLAGAKNNCSHATEEQYLLQH
jgi:hypothetical protein